jgi:hypothetical protein
MERSLNLFSWIVPWTGLHGTFLEPLFVDRSLIWSPRIVLSDEDDQPIRQVFHCKKTSSKKLNNLNEDDQPLVSQLQGKKSKKSSNKRNTNQPAQTKSNIASSRWRSPGAKIPSGHTFWKGKYLN